MSIKPLYLSILILLSFLAFIRAQDCKNPLLKAFNIKGLSTPESGASLPFCNDLKTGQTCCSTETVQAFQTRLNDLTTQLQAAASARDLYLSQLREQVIQQYQALEAALGDLSDGIKNIKNVNAAIASQIDLQREQIDAISNQLEDLNDKIDDDLQEYQNNRVNCFTTVLKVQVSAWCLACDPNYASKGVLDNGTITFAPALCTAISVACYPFLRAAEEFNPLYRAQESFQRVQNLITYIINFASTGAIPNTTLQGDISKSTNATERTISVPAGCADEQTCPWQCQNLFSNRGEINQTILANGAGVVGGADINFDNIGQTVSRRRRRLQQVVAVQWNPNLETTGVVYTVPSDPANVRVVIVPISALLLETTKIIIGLMIFVQMMLLF